MEPNENPWDEYADECARWLAKREPVVTEDGSIVARMLEVLGELDGREVLDAGCGEGFLARILAERGARVTGIDLSPRPIEMAREKDRDGGLPAEGVKARQYHRALEESLDAFFDTGLRLVRLVDVMDVAGLRQLLSLHRRIPRFMVLAFDKV